MNQRSYTPAAETDIRETFRRLLQAAGPTTSVKAPPPAPALAHGQLVERIYRQAWADGSEHGRGVGRLQGFFAGALASAAAGAAVVIARAGGWL